MPRTFSRTAQSQIFLCTASKLLERLVARQWSLLPSLQSGFRSNNSTETAVLRILSDLLEAVDSGDVAALLLHLSAAFDTVDHSILCHRLELYFGLRVRGPALAWF